MKLLLAFIAYFILNPAALAEMQLLQREMFATTGIITESSPGSIFSKVHGSLHLCAGGPRLIDGVAASADLRGDGLPSAAEFDFSNGNYKTIFTGAWFFIKECSSQEIILLSVCDNFGNMGPCYKINNGRLEGGVLYNTFQFTGFDRSTLLNRWIYLGIAVHLDHNNIGTVNYYYKLVGEPMQMWHAAQNASIGIWSVGKSIAGTWSFGPWCKARMGAPSVYSLANTNLSDVVYPLDLIEPQTRLTWYCNPANGDDNNDGSAPDKAWKTVSKINVESSYTGMLSANTFDEGDILIIDTSEAELELHGESLNIYTRGLRVKASNNEEWIRIKAYESIQSNEWTPTDTANVYVTSNTQPHIVLWEDDKWMEHPTGANFEAVKSQLESTPGSFWTDGNHLYVHPFGSTDPRTDSKRYERSYLYPNNGAAVQVQAAHTIIEDIHVGKTCLANYLDNDPIATTCLCFLVPPERAIIRHAYLYYGAKHNIAVAVGGAEDDVLLEDVQCEQGTPYVGPGGQSVFVSYNHIQEDLRIVHRYHRCKSLKNAGLIGSSEGVWAEHYPVFIVHNNLTPGEMDPFELIEFVDCDFSEGVLQGGSVKNIRFIRSRCKFIDLHSHVVAEESRFTSMNRCNNNWSIIEKNCIHELSGLIYINQIAGDVTLLGCTIDARQITGVFSFVWHSSLFTRNGPLNFTFKNNLVLTPENMPDFNVFSLFHFQDHLDINNNAYLLGQSRVMYQYNNGNSTEHLGLQQWQSIGHDLNSLYLSEVYLDALRPVPGSPLINTGIDLGLARDYTGKLFHQRNDIGAFESPPSTFETWRIENFSIEELSDPEISSATASYLNDGYSNLLKYALGITASHRMISPIVIDGKADGTCSVQYSKSVWPSDISVILQQSEDLMNWSSVSGTPNVDCNSFGISKITHLFQTSDHERMFFRLVISQ